MAQTIIRLYPNAAAADAAVKDLKAHFFGDDEIAVVDPSAGATVDEIAAAIAKKKILKAHAAALAPGVANGGTMVAVRAALSCRHFTPSGASNTAPKTCSRLSRMWKAMPNSCHIAGGLMFVPARRTPVGLKP